MATQSGEPTVVINGVELSQSQAETVRVALSSFELELENGLGSDEVGRQMVALYKPLVREIHRMIFPLERAS